MGETVPDDHEFIVPTKAVNSIEDMGAWLKSEAYEEYLGFINALNESVKNKSNKVTCNTSGVTIGILEMLDKLDLWIDQTPPIDQPQRFGNQAFAQWLRKVEAGAEELLENALPSKFHRAIPEIVVYLVQGFGNGTRIDYGTGHEMSFLMLLCCLFKILALSQNDKVAAANKIFMRYLTLVRKLQLTYRMEPAGSHGVWSLDDYQFVPFIWGSSQLIGQGIIEPRMFLDKEVVETYSEEYMFIGCIEFINKVKTGQFAEHSNQLWNISAVPTWTKINAGLLKMYKAEVLAKFPVIQHVLFGSLLPFKPPKPRPSRVTMHKPLSLILAGPSAAPPPPPSATAPSTNPVPQTDPSAIDTSSTHEGNEESGQSSTPPSPNAPHPQTISSTVLQSASATNETDEKLDADAESKTPTATTPV